MNRSTILLVSLLALQLCTAASVSLAAEVNVGEFKHGKWEGRCFRDGYLSGRNQEECIAWSKGSVQLELRRNSDQLFISATFPECARAVDGEVFPQSTLAASVKLGPKAVAKILRAVAKTVLTRAGLACNVVVSASALDVGDLEAVVKETDDLRLPD